MSHEGGNDEAGAQRVYQSSSCSEMNAQHVRCGEEEAKSEDNAIYIYNFTIYNFHKTIY